jgi:uncharacterized cupin superfamily protein
MRGGVLRSTSFHTARTDLALDPINPAWIKHGTPVARSVTLSRSPDSILTTGLWDCTAGTFTWIFNTDETVLIVEGEVRVREGATTQVLLPGMVAYFPRGLETVWEVPTYVKKAFILRSPYRSGIRRLASAAKRLAVDLKRRANMVLLHSGSVLVLSTLIDWQQAGSYPL